MNIRAILILVAIPVIVPLAAIIFFLAVMQTLQAMEQAGICLKGELIDNPAQAVAFAKRLILEKEDRSSDPRFARNGFRSPNEYIAAIEAEAECCSASYGERLLEEALRGWTVTIDAMHLEEEFMHEIEFGRCGTVSYNGGLSYKKNKD